MYQGNDPAALRQLNERNARFWCLQDGKTHRQISDETILKLAMKDMSFEIARGIPVGYRKTFEKALEDAEDAKGSFDLEYSRRFHTELSRKGGKAPKRINALQGLITKLVRNNPSITSGQLLLKLKKEIGAGVIISIDSDNDVLAGDVKKIHFMDSKGNEKTVSLYGLKDIRKSA